MHYVNNNFFYLKYCDILVLRGDKMNNVIEFKPSKLRTDVESDALRMRQFIQFLVFQYGEAQVRNFITVEINEAVYSGAVTAESKVKKSSVGKK
jgi:hypothetical protein